MPNPLELKLSPENLAALGERLMRLADAAIAEREPLEERWDRNRKFYLGNPDGSGYGVPKQVTPHHFPLTGPKIYTLVDNVAGTISSGRPMMRCIGSGSQSEAEQVEQIVQFFYDLAGFKRKLRQLCTIAAITGVAVVRPKFEAVEKGSQLDTYTEGRYQYKSCGLCFDTLDPLDFALSTSRTSTITSAALVGHRFYRTRAQVRALQEAGVYLKTEAHALPSASPSQNSTRDDDESLIEDHEPTEDENRIELFEAVVKKDVTEALEQQDAPYVSATFVKQDGRVLKLQSYPGDEPRYVDFRLFPEEYGSFWPSTSVANLLQGLQVQYNAYQNLIRGGSMLAAFPPILEKGAATDGSRPYEPGQIITTIGTEVTPLAIQFDVGQMWELISQIEKQADAVIGISQAGTAQQFEGDVTATEVANLQANMSTRLGGYMEEFTGGLERLTKIVQEILAENIETWYPVYADELPEMSIEQMKDLMERPWRWFSTARGAGDAPGALLQKGQMLLQMANEAAPLPEALAQSIVMGLSQAGIDPELAQQIAQQVLSQAEGPFDKAEIYRTIVGAMDFANADKLLGPLIKAEEAKNAATNAGGGMEGPMPMAGMAEGGIPAEADLVGLLQGPGAVPGPQGPY